MSLLNEALRKRSRSLDQAGKKDIFQTDRAPHRKGKTRIYGLVGIVALLGFFIVAGVWFGFLRADARPQQQTLANHYAVRRQKIVTEPVRLPEPPKMPVKQEPKAETIIAATSEQKEAKPYNTNVKQKEIAKGGLEKVKKPSKTKTLKTKKERNKEEKQNVQKPPEVASNSPYHGSQDLFYEKAIGYHRRNNLEMAIKMYLEVLRKNPEHSDALLNLSSAYIQSSKYSRAYPLLQKLKRFNPENSEVLLNLAIVEIGLGRPNRAINYLEMSESLKDEPQFEIYFHRGVALSHLNKLNEALVWYKKAESVLGNHPLLIFNMAVACDKLKKYDEALKYYVKFYANGGGSLSAEEKKKVETRISSLRVYLARL
jgi:tetratricopeptide (TPR) repeat protein